MKTHVTSPEMRRVAYNYRIDGDKGPTKPTDLADGFLTVSEIAQGLARIRRLHEYASDPSRVPGGLLPAADYAKMIDFLVAALPLARDAEAAGQAGMKYMQEPFYAMAEDMRRRGLTKRDIDCALNGDINFGNNNGIASRDEYCRASWYPGRKEC